MSSDSVTPHHDDSDRIEALVAECIDLMEEDGASALERFCADHPTVADKVRRRLAALHSMGMLEQGDSVIPPFPERLGPFQLIEKLGDGGMGVVYRAHQEPLGREVALKIIRPDCLYFDNARERFQREMSSAARLQHPGIVPIYTVGEQEGIPYFAMELVHGCTLAQALSLTQARSPSELTGEDLAEAARSGATESDGADHRDDPKGVIFEGTWAESSTRIALRVAEALQHVHDRGVLHRDIKPSNVMITPSGRVMLLDFGLASSEEDPRLTRSGSALGSLPYMSPEQLSGGHVDERSDIFSLGATLYELLTNKLPFRMESQGTGQLATPRFDPPRPVRGLNARVSWELETVCRTAIDPEPGRRYASARDLARDLTNVLEHRPIAAKRPGVGLRARRWLQRHPAVGASAVIALLLLAGGAVLYAWQQNDARAKIDRQRQSAIGNLKKAKEAVDRLLTRVAEETLLATPYMEEVRRDLLLDALEFYRGFLADSGDDLELRRDVADAFRQVGEIQQFLGDAGASRDAHESAIALYEELDDGDPDVVSGLAAALNELAKLYTRDLDRTADAAPLHARSLRLKEVLVDRFPDEPRYGRALANGLLNVAGSLTRTGRNPEAEEHARRALDILERLAAAGDDSLDRFEKTAMALSNLSVSVLQSGRPKDAVGPLTKGLETYESLLELRTRPKDRFNLAVTLLNLTTAYRASGRPDEANAASRRALEALSALTVDFPRVPDYRATLAKSYRDAARRAASTGDGESADAYFDRALQEARWLGHEYPEKHSYRWIEARVLRSKSIFDQSLGRIDDGVEAISASHRIVQKLADAHPEIVAYGDTLISTLNDKGALLLQAGRGEDAAEAFREGIRAADAFARRHPDHLSNRSAVIRLFHNLAFQLPPERYEEALEACARGLGIAQELVDGDPENGHHRTLLAEMLTVAGDLHHRTGEYPQAYDQYTRAYDLRRALHDAAPEDVAAASELGGSEINLGMAEWRRGELARAERLLRDGLDHQRGAHAQRPRDPFVRDYLGLHHVQLTKLLLEQRRHAEAAEIAAEYAAAFEGSASVHREVASLLAECAAIAASDENLSVEARERVANAYRSAAIAALQAAVAAGYRDRDDLLQNPDLDPLRSQDGFIDLLGMFTDQ